MHSWCKNEIYLCFTFGTLFLQNLQLSWDVFVANNCTSSLHFNIFYYILRSSQPITHHQSSCPQILDLVSTMHKWSIRSTYAIHTILGLCNQSHDNHKITSSNGNNFPDTGHCEGNSPVTYEFPLTKNSDAELWCFLWSAPEKRLSKQAKTRWLEKPSRSLRRHCNYISQNPKVLSSLFYRSGFLVLREGPQLPLATAAINMLSLISLHLFAIRR